jgi:hypothetical protein
MEKYKDKYKDSYWNYRIGTKLFSYKKEFEGKNEKMANFPNERLFSIIEVYYSADENKADSYVEKNPLDNLTSVEDIKWTLKKIKKALKKPILDLDNFPTEWEL